MPSDAPTQWFTSRISEEDFFFTPNFDLGQFFYTAATARRLADALDHYRNPCCLCTLRLASEWHRRGRAVRLLDCDPRFSYIPGFRHFDLLKPEPLNERVDMVVFDPILMPASTLLQAVRIVTSGNEGVDLFATFPVYREGELLSAFGDFNLRPLDFPMGYCNVAAEFHGLFKLYGCRPLHETASASTLVGRDSC